MYPVCLYMGLEVLNKNLLVIYSVFLVNGQAAVLITIPGQIHQMLTIFKMAVLQKTEKDRLMLSHNLLGIEPLLVFYVNFPIQT